MGLKGWGIIEKQGLMAKKEINSLTPDGIKLHVETSQNYSTKVTHKRNTKMSSVSTTAQGI